MQFLSLIPIAFTIILTVTASPATAEILTNDQIAKQIIGKNLTGKRNGMTVHLSYSEDGSVKVKAFVISASGSWKYSGTGICMHMTKGPNKGKTCLTFEHLGGNKYRNSKGMTLTVQD